MQLTKLRIFAASPTDVERERTALTSVVADLQDLADYAGVALELVDWRRVMPDFGRPEQVQKFFKQFAADSAHPGLFQAFDTPLPSSAWYAVI